MDAQSEKMIKDYLEQLGTKVEARVDALAKSFDRGFDRGADDPGIAPGMQAHVTSEQSSLNPITAFVPANTTLNASILFWQDLINQNIGITGNVPLAFVTTSATTITSVGTTPSALVITPANFNTPNVLYSPSTGTTVLTGTGTIGFLPPSWLGGGTIAGLNYFLSYQLSVAYLSQNITFFDVVNMFSSEAGNQAPVLRSAQIASTMVTPYSANASNVTPLINAATPQDQQQNQIISALGFVVSLFHYLVVTTQQTNASNVSLTMIFNAMHKEARGHAYREKIAGQLGKSGKAIYPGRPVHALVPR